MAGQQLKEPRHPPRLDPPLSLCSKATPALAVPPAMSVVVTTYNQPGYLLLALSALNQQTYTDFELIIGDDGSTAQTRAAIDAARDWCHFPIRHLWQSDDGFRKCRILNLAILAASAPYLVFSDGDCLPRADFLACHNRLRSRGSYLSGGYVKLTPAVTAQIDRSAVESGDFARRPWLRKRGLKPLENITKLASGAKLARILNAISRTRAGWHGHNSSCWRSDALAAGGFDERMGWGGEDREFGYRLINGGVQAARIRYSAICVHLDHQRPWRDPQVLEANDAMRDETRRSGRSHTRHGTDLHLTQARNGAVT